MKANKTAAELEQEIILITMKIQSEFPELSKFIREMPVKFSENGEVSSFAQSLQEHYESLANVLNDYSLTHKGNRLKEQAEKALFPGYPHYSSSEDIYKQAKELKSLNPENLSQTKAPNEESGTRNEKGFAEDMYGGDLDIPGAELDDQQEKMGNEDEENNFYSLGGDRHNGLEEDKG